MMALKTSGIVFIALLNLQCCAMYYFTADDFSDVEMLLQFPPLDNVAAKLNLSSFKIFETLCLN